MTTTRELIEDAVAKSDHVYIPVDEPTWRLPTGILTLDRILGGGIPSGSVVQLYGAPSSGKTTLAYHITGQAVKLGYNTLLVPLEGYSERYARMCGVNTNADNFNKFAADFAEITFNICIEAIRNSDTQVIVMDSISTAKPKADLEKKQKTNNMESGYNIGTQARAVSDFISKMRQPLTRNQAIFVTVNQLSYHIGSWGASKKPKGGEALQYFSDIKINMWGKADRKVDPPCILSILTIDKGKVWDVVPYGTTTLTIRHAEGIDIEADLVQACEKANIVDKKGTWFSYGEYKAQGLSNFAAILKENVKLKEELFNKAMSSDVEIEIGEPNEGAEDDEE